MGIHENNRIFKCDLCHKRFNFDENLQEHISTLYLHIRKVHENKKDHKCNICDDAFSTASELISHKQRIHEDKHTKCDFCEKRFKCNQHLSKHIKSTHASKVECSTCGKSFGQISKLYLHKRTVHENKKDYKCNICDKAFRTASALISHKKRIHERKNYKLQNAIGERNFQTEDDLIRNVNERNVSEVKNRCEYCLLTFMHKKSLNRHVRNKHKTQ